MRFFTVLFAALVGSGCHSMTRNRAAMGVPERAVIFSFDDGPNAQHDSTDQVLDVLRRHNIKAMFAVLGENVDANPELLRRIRDEGHTIINHGYSDEWAVYLKPPEFRENLDRAMNAIVAAAGEPPLKLYRPQGGFFRSEQRRAWEEAGYVLVPASVRAHDASADFRRRDAVVQRLLKRIEKDNGGMLVLHDGKDGLARMERGLAKRPDGTYNRSWIAGMLEELITVLEEKGYQLRFEVSLEEVCGLNVPPENVAGR